VAATGARRDDIPSAQDAGADTADLSSPTDLCPVEEAVVDSLEKIKAEAVIPVRAKPVVAAPLEMPSTAGADKCGRITLLPDEDGKVGRVFVKDGKGDEVKLETAYSASLDDCQKVTSGQSTDPRYKAMTQNMIQKLPAAARYYRINFALGKDEMLPESATVFKFLLEDYRKTAAPEVTLIGHSDKVGDPVINLRLSQKRAKAVYDLLTKDGAVPKSDIEQTWRGDRDPLPGTEGNKSEPRNRRVEVKIQ
jgi:outer membrane protein OmpA-like peptidoglycan-associated protein